MSSIPKLSMIAAVAKNGVIGHNGEIPWRIPEDFKYFKEKTMGKPIIMGRKTYESLPGILPGRWHIVVTSDYNRESIKDEDGKGDKVTFTPFFNDALAMAHTNCLCEGLDEYFIIGGAQMYKDGLVKASRLYITEVNLEPEGDTYFPIFGIPFAEVSRDKRIDDKTGTEFDFVVFERR